MKVASAIRRRCKHCYIVKRKGRLYVRCKARRRHKMRQGLSYLPPYASALGAPAGVPNPRLSATPFLPTLSFAPPRGEDLAYLFPDYGPSNFGQGPLPT